jgi:hypothetical protein
VRALQCAPTEGMLRRLASAEQDRGPVIAGLRHGVEACRGHPRRRHA